MGHSVLSPWGAIRTPFTENVSHPGAGDDQKSTTTHPDLSTQKQKTLYCTYTDKAAYLLPFFTGYLGRFTHDDRTRCQHKAAYLLPFFTGYLGRFIHDDRTRCQ